MRILIILLCLIALPAFAGNVYKCKGAQGEIIYQNDPCPGGARPIATGNYEEVPDQVYPQYSAEAVARARAQEQLERQRQAVAQQQTQAYLAQQAAVHQNYMAQKNAASDAAAIAGKDPRSPLGVAARTQELDRHNDHSWMTNCHQHCGSRAARRSAEATAATAPPPAPVAAAPTPPANITDCRAGVAGNFTCYNSNGQASFGNRNATGGGTVSGPDNQVEYINKNPSGVSTVNGVCIRDVYGNCT